MAGNGLTHRRTATTLRCMKTSIVRAALTTAVITLALVAMPSHAIAPLIALLGKGGGLDAGQLAELAELKECMLVLPQSAPAMGMAMGMMKPMLAQFREARDEMRALPADEQDELAATLAEEFDKVPAADRKDMLAELRSGLFPPRVVEILTRRYGGQ